jgi:hypothetical protein
VSPGRGCAGCHHPALSRLNGTLGARLLGQPQRRCSLWSRSGCSAADRCSLPSCRCCCSWPGGAWLLGLLHVSRSGRSPLPCPGSPTWLPPAWSPAPRLPMPSMSYDGMSRVRWPTGWHPSSARFDQASTHSPSTTVITGTTRCAAWSLGWPERWTAAHLWPTWWPRLRTINGGVGGGPPRPLRDGRAYRPSVRWSSVSCPRSSCSASFRSC